MIICFVDFPNIYPGCWIFEAIPGVESNLRLCEGDRGQWLAIVAENILPGVVTPIMGRVIAPPVSTERMPE